jgi:DNA-binding NtrC family response regulator
MSFERQAATVPAFPIFGEPKWPLHLAGDDPAGRTTATSDKKPKIIVIDDESLIAETVVEILNGEGFEAISVSSGASAIDLAKNMRPAIVLSDVIMPGLNGIETGIKIQELVPNCRVILFSGQAATVDLLEKARERGHRFDILAKPIKPEHLIRVIRSNLPSQ